MAVRAGSTKSSPNSKSGGSVSPQPPPPTPPHHVTGNFAAVAATPPNTHKHNSKFPACQLKKKSES